MRNKKDITLTELRTELFDARAQIRLAGNTPSQPAAYLIRNRSVAAQQSRFTIAFHREAIAPRISKGIDERGGNFFIHSARQA
jgi:hypothetical protein